jgi:hypothetical protein
VGVTVVGKTGVDRGVVAVGMVGVVVKVDAIAVVEAEGIVEIAGMVVMGRATRTLVNEAEARERGGGFNTAGAEGTLEDAASDLLWEVEVTGALDRKAGAIMEEVVWVFCTRGGWFLCFFVLPREEPEDVLGRLLLGQLVALSDSSPALAKVDPKTICCPPEVFLSLSLGT